MVTVSGDSWDVEAYDEKCHMHFPGSIVDPPSMWHHRTSSVKVDCLTDPSLYRKLVPYSDHLQQSLANSDVIPKIAVIAGEIIKVTCSKRIESVYFFGTHSEKVFGEYTERPPPNVKEFLLIHLGNRNVVTHFTLPRAH